MIKEQNTLGTVINYQGLAPLGIVHVVPRYYPALGGVEEFVRRCAEIQASRGHDVSIVTSNLIRPGSSERFPVGVDSYNGVKIVRCRAHVLFPGRFYFVQGRTLKVLRELSPDVVHVHGNKCFASDLVSAWCKLTGRPFVFSPHAGKLGTTLVGKIHNSTLGLLSFSAPVVHCVSASERELIRSVIKAPVRTVVIPPGIDIGEIDAAEGNVFKTIGVKEQKIILSVGRLEANKGFDLLIRAIRQVADVISDIHAVIVGDDFGVRSDLQRLSERLGVTHYVTIVGRLARAELLSAYKNCTVFCHPARTEGFGIVVAEAMACGAPVIAGRIPVMQELLGLEERGLMFSPEDHAALGQQIVRILGDTNLRQSLAREGQRFARSLTWEETANKLESLYYQVCDKPSGGMSGSNRAAGSAASRNVQA